MQRIDLVRHPEQHAALVGALALGRVRRPGRIAGGGVERGGVLGLVLHPALDLGGEGKLGDVAADQGFDLAPQGAVGVEGRGHVRRIFLGGAALHEQPLDAVERRQHVVAPPHLRQFARDAEQLAEEIFQLGRQRQDQFRLRLAGNVVRRGPRGEEAAVKRSVAPGQKVEEARVESHESFPVIEVREVEAEGGKKRRKHREQALRARK